MNPKPGTTGGPLRHATSQRVAPSRATTRSSSDLRWMTRRSFLPSEKRLSVGST